jgi:hypothetical protein
MRLAKSSLRQKRSEIPEGKEFGQGAFRLDQRQASEISKLVTLNRVRIKCFNFRLRDHR